MEKVTPEDMGKTLKGAAVLLKDLGVALTDACDPKDDGTFDADMLAANFIADLKPMATMLAQDKSTLKKLSSVVTCASRDAEKVASGEHDGISPVRIRLLTHKCGKLILERAQAFLADHQCALRHDIHMGSYEQLLARTTEKAKEMVAASPEDEQSWEIGFAKLADNLGKTLAKVEEDIMCSGFSSWRPF